MMEMISIAQNLRLAWKDTATRARFRDCFTNSHELYIQRCTLAHEYGVKVIEWGKVMRTIEVIYPRLEAAVGVALAVLENEGT